MKAGDVVRLVSSYGEPAWFIGLEGRLARFKEVVGGGIGRVDDLAPPGWDPPIVSNPYIGNLELATEEDLLYQQMTDELSRSEDPMPKVLEPTTIPSIDIDSDIDFDKLAARFPDYNVLLWNDDVTPMEIVIYALQQSLPGMTNEAAIRHMLEAHTNGKAAVARCKIEEAELYRDRLIGFKITASIEQA